MISQGIGRENIQTLEPIESSQVSIRKPIKPLATHVDFCTQPLNSPKSWLGKLMPWEWGGMAVQNRVWASHPPWKNVLASWGKNRATKWLPKPLFTMALLPHAVLAAWAFSRHGEKRFLLFPSREGRFSVLYTSGEEGKRMGVQ
jgi:hypothetical protein